VNLDEYLNQRLRLIDDALESLLPAVAGQPGRLREAMRYGVFSGGKRIRPIIALAAAEAVGGNMSDALPAACAIELIHAFSLIHDDLPCMDDDDLRRGKPTSHKVFGEATALLAADGLFALAFDTLAHAPESVPDGAVLEAVRILAGATGPAGMVGGQVLDLEAEGKDVTVADVERIHRGKTGALIEAAALIGGIIGGGDKAQIETLGRYGRAIGLAFQIVDDLLESVGDEEKLGKSAQSDLKRRKATYPAVAGVEESARAAERHCQQAAQELSSFEESAEPLRRIARLIVEREV